MLRIFTLILKSGDYLLNRVVIQQHSPTWPSGDFLKHEFDQKDCAFHLIR